MGSIIELRSVRKSFKKLRAVNDVSFEIESGMATAIVGPNASGKSTVLKCILGLVVPDAGEISVAGQLVGNNAAYRELIGYMPQLAAFPDAVNLIDLLALLGKLRKQTPDAAGLIELFGVGAFRNRPVRELSCGTKQKINAICAMAFQPEVLILDEPTQGLDPLSSICLKERLAEEKARGITVVFTTHVMSEVEEIADHIVVLLDGQVHFSGALSELRAETGEERVERAVAVLMTRKRLFVDV